MRQPGSAGDLAIETRGLTKKFGAHAAVDGVDLNVPHGAVFGFLGPNGSGKTTTIRMLLGLVNATSGEARVLGRQMPGLSSTVLPRVGALVEGPAFYPFLSGMANLIRFDTADPRAQPSTRRARATAALERVGLGHAAGKRVGAYSLGMKQRLGIASALLRPRELLVLDEPTNGLDPQGTREVRSLVRSLAEEGTTVFVSSHLLAEIEQICSHAGIMSAGRLVAQGTLAELRGAGRRDVRVLTPDIEPARAVLARLGLEVKRQESSEARGGASGADAAGADAAGADAGEVRARIGRSAPPAEKIVEGLVAAGIRVRGFSVEGVSLEDRFVALTGEGFDVEQ